MNARIFLPLALALSTLACEALPGQVDVKDTSSNSVATTAGESDPGLVDKRPGAWFEGGTLYHGTLEDWRQATSANRLATCADFAVSVAAQRGTGYRNMNEVRRDAEALADRIDRAARNGARNTELVELASKHWQRVED